MVEVRGVVPKLTRLLFASIRTGAEWVTEKFISLCEALVLATVWSVILVFIAVLMIDGSTWLQSRVLMIAGAVIGLIGFGCFAIASSIFRMGIEALTSLSTIVKREVERLSNIMFVGVLAIFYLSLDRAYEHPFFLFGFLCTLAVLYWATILPGESGLIGFFKSRFQWIVLLWAISLTLIAITPQAMATRLSNGHWLEKASGTIATEIPFRVDDQDQIINGSTNQPMVFFDQVGTKGSDEPRPLIGWTRDNKGQYHLYSWFDGQKNYNNIGREIKPVTTGKLDDIVIETKRAGEKKIVDDKKIVADQKAAAEAESVKAKAVADKEATKAKAEGDQKLKAQQTADELALQQTGQAGTERLPSEAKQQEQHQSVGQPISVASTILAPTDQSQDIVVVRPSGPFTYQGQEIQPDTSVISLDITEVTPVDKNNYELVLQPQMLISGGQKYDISHQTGLIRLTVRKDNSRRILKILSGVALGTTVGAITGGKKGAAAGAVIGGVAGTVFAVASHGQKFQLTVGAEVPPIRIRPVP